MGENTVKCLSATVFCFIGAVVSWSLDVGDLLFCCILFTLLCAVATVISYREESDHADPK